MRSADDLRDKVDCYQSTKTINSMGEHEESFVLVRSFWANISPSSGRREEVGISERANVTHKVVCRELAMPGITTDTYFMIRGQKLTVEYWYPIYNRKGWIEIFCKAVME